MNRNREFQMGWNEATLVTMSLSWQHFIWIYERWRRDWTVTNCLAQHLLTILLINHCVFFSPCPWIRMIAQCRHKSSVGDRGYLWLRKSSLFHVYFHLFWYFVFLFLIHLLWEGMLMIVGNPTQQPATERISFAVVDTTWKPFVNHALLYLSAVLNFTKGELLFCATDWVRCRLME